MHTHPALPQGRKKSKKICVICGNKKNPNKKSLEKDLLLGKNKTYNSKRPLPFFVCFFNAFSAFFSFGVLDATVLSDDFLVSFPFDIQFVLGIVQMMDYALYPRIRDPRFREPAVLLLGFSKGKAICPFFYIDFGITPF